MFRVIISVLLLGMHFVAYSAEEPDNASVHKELRNLLDGIETAINGGRYGDMAVFFHNNMRVTTINQEVLSSPAEIDSYFGRWFGPDGYLSKLHITLTADALTEFYADNTVGVVRGHGEESYILADGRSFEMLTRWTATVILDKDGGWQILALHIGTNFLDNPILAKAEGAMVEAALIGFLIGIVAILLIGYIIRRIRSRPNILD